MKAPYSASLSLSPSLLSPLSLSLSLSLSVSPSVLSATLLVSRVDGSVESVESQRERERERERSFHACGRERERSFHASNLRESLCIPGHGLLLDSKTSDGCRIRSPWMRKNPKASGLTLALFSLCPSFCPFLPTSMVHLLCYPAVRLTLSLSLSPCLSPSRLCTMHSTSISCMR